MYLLKNSSLTKDKVNFSVNSTFYDESYTFIPAANSSSRYYVTKAIMVGHDSGL